MNCEFQTDSDINILVFIYVKKYLQLFFQFFVFHIMVKSENMGHFK